VELNEAARRIFLQHWWLIAVGVIVGATIGAVVAGTSNSYTASTRLVIDTQDPKARAESTAIADTARAIATSPLLVQKALARAGATNRDANGFSANDVSVTALGTSGVLSLSVTDRSRAFAASVANALAREVIQTRLKIANGQLDANQAKLTSRIDSLTESIAGLDASIGKATRQLVGASAAKRTALQARLTNLTRQEDFLTQQRGILQSEQASLIGTDNGKPSPVIISPATAAGASPAGSSVGSSGALGGLLGLFAALVVAGILEAVRPTLAGGEAVARELGKPHLGTFSVDTSGRLGVRGGIADIADPLKEAARRAGVANIDLLGVGTTVDLALIAGALDSAVAAPGPAPKRAAGAGGASRNGREVTVRPFGPREVAEGKGTGLVVIAPAVLKRTTLAEVTQLVRMTPSPLLGVITYKPTQSWWSSLIPERRPAPEKSETLQVADKQKAEVARRR
jgi:capsular polysaccharide biosynthesis protein